MSHQEQIHSTTPLQALKELFQNAIPDNHQFQPRHGNAVVKTYTLVVTALMAFGGTAGKSLTQRCKLAMEAATRILPHCAIGFTSRQGLFKSLTTGGEQLVQQVRTLLTGWLVTRNDWLLFGKPTFAVDGSRFLLSRTKANQAYFSASIRKGATNYKKNTDAAKAATTQCNFSLCYHLGSFLPYCWQAADSSQGERGLLLGMIDKLPPASRLVMDAFYFGYEFWQKLIAKKFTFVVRAGSNLELLKMLGDLGGKIKQRDGLVFYWPENAMHRGAEPILLLCVEVMVGRKKMFLVTNELALSNEQLSTLYGKRWGIEVFFRTVKQSWERSKLESRTPKHVMVEMQWTLLGIWLSLWTGYQQHRDRTQASAIRILRTIAALIIDVARCSTLRCNLASSLAACVKTDESGRTTSKASRNYPRKKKHKPTGEPLIRHAANAIAKLLRMHLTEKSLPA